MSRILGLIERFKYIHLLNNSLGEYYEVRK